MSSKNLNRFLIKKTENQRWILLTKAWMTTFASCKSHFVKPHIEKSKYKAMDSFGWVREAKATTEVGVEAKLQWQCWR